MSGDERIQVRRRTNPFVQVDKTAATDKRLTLKAKGLLLLLLSAPPAFNWRMGYLISICVEGRDVVRSAFKELVEHGYARRRRIRIEHGRFAWETEVADVPLESIVAGQTIDGFSVDGETVHGASTDGEPVDLIRERQQEDASSSLRSEDGVTALVDRTAAEKIATKHLQPIIETVTDGYGYDLRAELEPVWTAAILEARQSQVNTNAVGIAICARYIFALTNRQPTHTEYGLIGRLVAQHGKLALAGIEGAYMRAIDNNEDQVDWLRYATAICKRILEERPA